MNINFDSLKPIMAILAWIFAVLGLVAMVGVDVPLAGGSSGTFFLASIAAALLGSGVKSSSG